MAVEIRQQPHSKQRKNQRPRHCQQPFTAYPMGSSGCMVDPKGEGHATGGYLRQGEPEKNAPAQDQMRAHQRTHQSENSAAQ
jgi:hypothetical protein